MRKIYTLLFICISFGLQAQLPSFTITGDTLDKVSMIEVSENGNLYALVFEGVYHYNSWTTNYDLDHDSCFIFKSTDNGYSWIQVSDKMLSWDGFFLDYELLSDSILLIARAGHDLIYKLSWNQNYFDIDTIWAYPLCCSSEVRSIDAISENRFITLKQNRWFYTKDYGQTFDTCMINYSDDTINLKNFNRPGSVSLLQNGKGYMLNMRNNGSVLYSTLDSGVTWDMKHRYHNMFSGWSPYTKFLSADTGFVIHGFGQSINLDCYFKVTP